MTESAASDIAGKFVNRLNVCVQGYNIIICTFWLLIKNNLNYRLLNVPKLCQKNAHYLLTTLVSVTCNNEDIYFNKPIRLFK